MRRILYLWIILLISASGNRALGQMNKSQVQTQALDLKVISKASSVCYGENLSIEMELKNKSKDEIAINSEELWSFITFRAFKPSKFGVNGEKGIMLIHPKQSHPKNDFAILESGDVYKKTVVVSLNEQFFKEESEVEFDVSYMQLEERDIGGVPLWTGEIISNKLKLQIKQCASDEKTAQQPTEKHYEASVNRILLGNSRVNAINNWAVNGRITRVNAERLVCSRLSRQAYLRLVRD
jgi:hypothetical protein